MPTTQSPSITPGGAERSKAITAGELRSKIMEGRIQGRLPPWTNLPVREGAELIVEGAQFLIQVAAMATEIQDFPGDVVMRGPDKDHPDMHWTALQRDLKGRWRIVSGQTDPAKLRAEITAWSRATLVHNVGRALGIERLEQKGYATLDAYGRLPAYPGEVASFIERVRGSVPTQALATPLNAGFSHHDSMGRGAKAHEIMEAWGKALKARGLDLDRPTSPALDAPPLIAFIGRDAITERARHVEALVRAGANMEVRDAAGRTPLLAALDHGSIGIASRLIGLGADVHAVSTDGRSAMDCLIGSAQRCNYFEDNTLAGLAEALAERGVEATGDASAADRMRAEMDEFAGSDPYLKAYIAEIQGLDEGPVIDFEGHTDSGQRYRIDAMLKAAVALEAAAPAPRP